MKDKYKIVIILIFILGFLVRIVGIDKFPDALNVDEASIGYEAFSISNYGIDRNGNSWPVFLEAWGSGQNALYAYIIMPFIKILGLSIFSMRLPMAICSCISLFVMYKILEKQKNKKLTIIGLAFFAITPWHIMKSRWGLESNIFPEIMLWAAYFLISGIQENKIGKFYIGSIFIGICGYAYGTSYYFLPIFFVLTLIILLVKKKIKIWQALIALGIVALICLPIMLMLLINSFDLPEIHIGCFTIPKLASNRYETLTVLSSDNIFKTLKTNFVQSMKILIKGQDGIIYNGIFPYGIIYITSIPIAIIGMIKSIKKKNATNFIFGTWFIAAFTLLFICEPNINRMNILFIPLIYYTSLGLYELITTLPRLKWIIIAIYVVQFISFGYTYLHTDVTKESTFNRNIENIITYADTIEADTVYFEYAIKEQHIYVLFYNKINTNEFVNTVKYKNDVKGFDSVIGFGKYKFELPEKIENQENNAYVMKKEKEQNYEIDENIWKKTYIDDFLVLTKNGE